MTGVYSSDFIPIDPNTGTVNLLPGQAVRGEINFKFVRNNSEISLPSITVSAGPVPEEVFAIADSNYQLPNRTWAAANNPNSALSLKNNAQLWIRPGFAPAIGESTLYPPATPFDWNPGATITDIEIISTPSGWISYIEESHQGGKRLNIYNQTNTTGNLVMNVLTPCGWTQVTIKINGFG